MTTAYPPRTSTLALVGTIVQVIFFIVWLSLFTYGISQAPIFR